MADETVEEHSELPCDKCHLQKNERLPKSYCCLTQLEAVYRRVGIPDWRNPRCAKFEQNLHTASCSDCALIGAHESHYLSELLVLACAERILHAHNNCQSIRVLIVTLHSPNVRHDARILERLRRVLDAHLPSDAQVECATPTQACVGKTRIECVTHRSLDTISSKFDILYVHNIGHMINSSDVRSCLRTLAKKASVRVASIRQDADKLFDCDISQLKWLHSHFGDKK